MSFRFHPSRTLVRRAPSVLALAALAAATFSARPSGAQTISVIPVPSGYDAGSIPLPRPFTGALAVDPTDDDVVFASVGSFLDSSLVRVDLTSGTATTIALGPFGNLAGIAAFSPTELVLLDNATAASGPYPGETILIARDDNPADGDFDDAGEIVELIAPILTADFSGAQARIVPPGVPSGIPSGSLMFQTADGGGGGELLVVADPLGAAAYRPAGAPYFTGFDFNGGFDFDASGRIFMGTLNGTNFTGEVFALVNLDGDEDIDPGESNLLVAGEPGMGDLVVDAEDDILFAGATPSFAAGIRTFRAPADPLSGTVSPGTLATTDAGFLSGLILNSRSRPFEPNAGPGGATLLFGGFTSDFSPGRNLATLTPSTPPNDAMFAGHTIPATMFASSNRTIQIEVRNTGGPTWTPEAEYRLALIEDSCGLWVSPFPRADLPPGTAVAKGESHTFGAFLAAYGPPATCTLRFRMVEEHVEFFGETLTVTIDVVDPPNAAADWAAYE